MTTIANNFFVNNATLSEKTEGITLGGRYNKFIENLKFSHFGVMTMAILIGTCLGSISAMFVFYNHGPIWVFAVGMFASVANLVTCISQSPTKWVVNIFLLTLLINISLLFIYPIW